MAKAILTTALAEHETTAGEGTTLPEEPDAERRIRVIIIGGGFAGLEAAKSLRGLNIDVLVIDKTNHHVFQPLLYQVATAQLAPSDISAPIRHILRKQKNAEVIMGKVNGIDPETKIVYVDDEKRPYEYDYLILAAGTRHSYFGKDAWEKDAPGLKTLSDALTIRQRFLMAFEEAEKTTDMSERAALLTFVIVGAGPTGCEMAGVLPEIARYALRPEFRNFDTMDTRVILIEAGPRILAAFPEDLARRAQKDLEKLGVQIRTSTRVTNITAESVTVEDNEVIPTRTVIWAAGNMASPLAKFLNAPLDKAGRVLVNPDLSVPGHPEIFVAGDLASVKNTDGSPVPNVAQPAIQEGARAGANVRALLYRGRTEPFKYFNKGDMAVIGRNKAIANLSPLHLGHWSGFLAWLMWLFIHILYLVGFRNRLSVVMQWAYAYLTYQRGVRLITQYEVEKRYDEMEAEKSVSGQQ